MNDHDREESVNKTLTEKISELESLIDSKKAQKAQDIPVLTTTTDGQSTPAPVIPVLDDVVTDEASHSTPGKQELIDNSYTKEQLIALINNIENKLTTELEDLVNTIKGSMKDSIIDELQTRLESSENSSPENNSSKITDIEFKAENSSDDIGKE